MNTLDPHDNYPFQSHRTMAEVMAAEAAGPEAQEPSGDGGIRTEYYIGKLSVAIPLVSAVGDPHVGAINDFPPRSRGGERRLTIVRGGDVAQNRIDMPVRAWDGKP